MQSPVAGAAIAKPITLADAIKTQQIAALKRDLPTNYNTVKRNAYLRYADAIFMFNKSISLYCRYACRRYIFEHFTLQTINKLERNNKRERMP